MRGFETRSNAGFAAGLSSPAAAQVQDWPLLFDTTVIHHLNLSTMSAADITCSGAEDPTTWEEIQQDDTNLVEHPALFWADGEEASKLCVTLRHKGENRLGNPLDPKIALKIDINELVPGQRWHGMRKVSLEEGSDTDVAREGIGWLLQRMAADDPTTAADYTPGPGGLGERRRERHRVRPLHESGAEGQELPTASRRLRCLGDLALQGR